MVSLLQTKLTIPTIRPERVVRGRLLQQLDALRRCKLALVSAPAGFGKTTLLAAYGAAAAANAAEEMALAWLSLGEDDNDPARFWLYLLATLSAAGVSTTLEAGAATNLAPDLVMTEVINGVTVALADRPDAHLTLILDDYHLIHNKVIHEAMTFLLEHMPATMHLVLAGRADPPLPLARWRAHNQLLELRQQDLRFTLAETTEFLNRLMGLQLSVDTVQTLNGRTEGWVAGLQMAALSLQGRSDPAAFVQGFGGSNRYVLDYLMEEVLLRQPEEVTHFLLKTAVLERLTAPLCAALLAEPGQAADASPAAYRSAQQILEQLESANLFLLPLDDERRWYRYHRLFADLLYRRLVQTQPAQVGALRRRAAAWFEANGYLEEAIDQTLAAGAFTEAARLIAEIAETMLMRSELVTVMGWLSALPQAELTNHPSLSLYYAWILIMEGHAQAKVELALRHARQEGAPGELDLVHSLLVLLHGDGGAAVDLARRALAQLMPERTFLRGLAAWVLGLALLFQGEMEEGGRTLEEAVHLGQQVGNMTVAAASLGRLAQQAWRDGDLQRARRLYEQVLVLATDEAERPLPISGEAYIGLAGLHYEWDELETALEHAETGLALTERWREIAAMAGLVRLARIYQVRGNTQAANRALARAQEIAHESQGTQLDDLAVAIASAMVRLIQGDYEAVAAWCAARQLPDQVDAAALAQRDDLIEGHIRKYELIILARLRLAQQRPGDALALLQPLLADAQRLARSDLQLELEILTALAYRQRGEAAAADDHLQAALALGRPGQFIRTFVEAGPEIGALLQQQTATDPQSQAYVNRLLAACGRQPHAAAAAEAVLADTQPLIEPLSERELEVLALISRGLSNREIAAELVLSLPTIKWHTSNIYGKLGVRNRTTAVARARELHLLP